MDRGGSGLKSDRGWGCEREARVTWGSGGRANGKFFGDHALYIFGNALFGGLFSKRWSIRIVRECRKVVGNNPEGKREMYESSRVLENPNRYGMS